MSQAPNPFAPPKAAVLTGPASSGDDRRVWRDNKVLVTVIGAGLPDRCLKCNAPTDFKLKRTLQWHSPIVYALIAINVILYAVVAMAVRKTAVVEMPLCAVHQQKRKQGVMLAWSSVLVGAALIGLAIAIDQPGLIALGFLALLVVLVVGLMKMAVLQPTKIDKTHFFAKGACDEYLASLPVWPGIQS